MRHVEFGHRIRPLAVELPLRVLIVLSSPSDRDELDSKREKELLEQALAPLISRGEIVVEYAPRATLPCLQKMLRRGTYQLFHYVGHGGFERSSQEGVLIFEDPGGRSQPVSAQQLGTLLHDHSSMRLAVLNACEGGRASRSDPHDGIASNLIQQGIPAVIAMQFAITDKVALSFTEEFYTALVERMPIDAALAETRKAIFALPNDIEWATPVLYISASNSVFLEAHPVTSPTASSSQPAPSEPVGPTPWTPSRTPLSR